MDDAAKARSPVDLEAGRNGAGIVDRDHRRALRADFALGIVSGGNASSSSASTPRRHRHRAWPKLER
jgi:hypothetical protein